MLRDAPRMLVTYPGQVPSLDRGAKALVPRGQGAEPGEGHRCAAMAWPDWPSKDPSRRASACVWDAGPGTQKFSGLKQEQGPGPAPSAASPGSASRI